MDFWSSYEKKRVGKGFGSDHLWMKTGDRYSLSLADYPKKGLEVDVGRAIFQKWDPKRRYLIAKNVDFDLFVSFYDVNSRGIAALRLAQPIEKEELEAVKKVSAQMKNANIEMRIIGLQNGDLSLVPSIKTLGGLARSSLVEVDLFGNQTRHLMIDLLTGKPYSLLLENRIYRPGELITATKKEDFEMMKSGLKFN